MGRPNFGRNRRGLPEPTAKALRLLVANEGIEGAADLLGSSRTTIEKLVSGGTVMPASAERLAKALAELGEERRAS